LNHRGVSVGPPDDGDEIHLGQTDSLQWRQGLIERTEAQLLNDGSEWIATTRWILRTGGCRRV
jgi:hypothetical protein